MSNQEPSVIEEGIKKFSRTADHPLAGTAPTEPVTDPANMKEAVETFTDYGQAPPQPRAERPTLNSRGKKVLAGLAVTAVAGMAAGGYVSGGVNALTDARPTHPSAADIDQNKHVQKLADSGNPIAQKILNDK